ncbi:DUF1592 domain-containing protein [Paraliomyxa miuraensis]|uniref:DUF1592 domain-containing protein n=1 Tax=Paraliomyxa miuraensis TaxID=376150 RepID=UPI002250DA04|nr:DUF1592 domain-containing protein [Paraliomyxa miuraensis]MCX4241659.1 DUF1592 domain-containing protein [Paraliomyxa miuraensis]
MSRSTHRRPRGRAWASPRPSVRLDPALVLASLLLVPGCYQGLSSFDQQDPTDGGSSSGADGADDDESGGDDGPAAACVPGQVVAARAPLRSLTTTQYRHAVTDLLGTSVVTEESLQHLQLITDGAQGGFASTTAGFDPELTRRYLELAEGLAEVYVSDRLPQVLACDWAQTSCIDTLLDGLGRRAFRRPLDPSERADFVGLYTSLRDQQGPSIAVQALVTALLASPAFLYLEEEVVELPGDGQEGVVLLDPHATASRLSFFLWSSVPDDALLDAAEAGELDEPEQIEVQVLRMMDDPRFLRTVESFHTQWLGVGHLDDLELGDSMTRELVTFVDDLFTAGDSRIETLLGSSHTFVDADLAALYGVEPPAEPFGRVELDPQQRAGVLTQLGFLQHTGAIFPEVHRGIFVRESLLCSTLPPPPEGAVDANAGLETSRVEDPVCGACHRWTDPIGHGFDNYDGLGRFQSLDADGDPLQADGEIEPIGADGVEGTFETIPELAQLLIGEPEVNRCFAIQWSRYALQRLDTSAERCTMDAFSEIVATSDGDLRSLVVAIATSEWFRSRAASDFQAP